MITVAAVYLVAILQCEHGSILFYQSGVCSDGSSPMCYPQHEFVVSDNNVWLGDIGGSAFSVSRPQFEYWKHTQLVIDVVPARGGCPRSRMGAACGF
jgi:uncharacterized protein